MEQTSMAKYLSDKQPLQIISEVEQCQNGECGEMTTPKRKTIILQGLHFSIHTPTEERLTVQIDGMTPEAFRTLGFAVEDWSRVVDDRYKQKSVRGRGWKGRGKRLTQAQRIRIDGNGDKLIKFASLLLRYALGKRRRKHITNILCRNSPL